MMICRQHTNFEAVPERLQSKNDTGYCLSSTGVFLLRIKAVAYFLH